ncbi:hypothetical protein AB1Y20_003035 [Prymnesium parvum]|uniref:PH domain-containing protein n=1 Tax=Prymnesium parvum TaxID=97485 RepID=A0AB34JAS4_PRYPA
MPAASWMAVRLVRSLLLALLLLLALAAASAYLLFDVRSFLLWSIRARLAELGCPGLPVSLDAASATFWSLEMRGLTVGNLRGEWRAPYAMRMERVHLRVAGLLALLSLHPCNPPHLLRFGELEFTVGFRVKALEVFEVEGMRVYIEDAHELPRAQDALLRGAMGKRPLNGGMGPVEHREVVLEATRISWYDHAGAQKAKGMLRLYASSAVEPVSGGGLPFAFEVISGADRLTLLAASEQERDAWVEAIRRAVREVGGVADLGGEENNAPWFAAIVAEDEGRKAMWRRRAAARRHEWRERWQASEQVARGAAAEEGAAAEAEGGGKGRAWDPLTDFMQSLKKHAAWAQRTAATGARLVEASEAAAAETRFDESTEFMIGNFVVHSMEVHMKDQVYALASDGWELRGFVGSENELKRQLFYVNEAEVKRQLLLGRVPQMGLFAKLLKDSGQRAVVETISDFTGKHDYQVGDISRAAIRKIGHGVATSVSEFTGKEEYHFGDISRAALAKVGSVFHKHEHHDPRKDSTLACVSVDDTCHTEEQGPPAAVSRSRVE